MSILNSLKARVVLSQLFPIGDRLGDLCHIGENRESKEAGVETGIFCVTTSFPKFHGSE
jgi:hypothetical protein